MSEIEQLSQLRDWLNTQIIGQHTLTERLLLALLADGHLLVEGAPGLAKTRAIKTLSDAIEGSFQRIQFTPDLLPGDVTGSDIYRPETGVFEFQRGPVFHNLLLADEINRAPAKVQSALLEAMASGCACVATDAGADGEVLAGGAGIVISTQGVTTQLRTLLPVLRDQRLLTAELGRQARRRVMERYTLSANIDSIERLYRELNSPLPLVA